MTVKRASKSMRKPDVIAEAATPPVNPPVPTVSGVNDKEMKLRSRAEQLHASAERAVITTDEHHEKAIDLAKYIRVTRNNLEDERKAIVKPFNDGVKAINDRFKIFTNVLDKAKQVIDGKLLAFERKKREEEQKAAELARVSTESFDAPDALDDVHVPVAPIGASRGTIGSASVITKYDFKVVDIKAVPTDLLLVDAVEVRRRINGKEKVTDIPGLEIFETQSLTVR